MHFYNLPFLAVVATASILAAMGLSLVTALYTVEFEPCYNSQTTAGVTVRYLICDEPKLLRNGYECNEDFYCAPPMEQCIRGNRLMGPIDQARSYLRLSGACLNFYQVKYEVVEYGGNKCEEYRRENRVAGLMNNPSPSPVPSPIPCPCPCPVQHPSLSPAQNRFSRKQQ